MQASDEESSRWRPTYHLIAPGGFMNDPCAPGYIPSRGLYHVGFQWNPKSAEWADIVWGKAFSRDLVTWEVSGTPSLERDAAYDRAGVFTGCWRPTGPTTGPTGRRREGGDMVDDDPPEELAIFYTSVSRVPIHYAREYHYGSETLSLATSRDGGATWEKSPANPILPGPPEGFAATATGWRDPFVAAWPSMRSTTTTAPEGGDGGGDLFGIVSGGVRDTSPTTWLYKVDGEDSTRWAFIAPLVMPGLHFSPSRWTGDLGVNWEVTNFLSLGGDGPQDRPQDFLILGAEGCRPPHGGAGVVQGTRRCNRAALWMAIDDAREADEADEAARRDGDGDGDGSPLMKFSYGGIFDHGLLYAANGFWDPASRQQVVIGWVTEEDLPVELQVRQGWSGCLSLPRNVSLATTRHVSGASRSALGDITSIRARPEEEEEREGEHGGGLCTVQTLRIAPDARLERLRARAARRDCEDGPLGPGGGRPRRRVALRTAAWEARARFSGVGRGGGGGGRVGLVIHHGGGASSSETETETALYFSPADETFCVDRPGLHRAGLPPLQLQQERAPLTLFTTRDPRTGVEAEERLAVHAFYDRSVLEVFVNERAVITTRVYLEAAECTGLEFFAEPEGVTLVDAVVWDGLAVQ